MRRAILGISLAMIAAATQAAENNLTIVGGIDFGFKKLRLDIEGRNSGFEPSYITINPTLGLSYDAFYATASYDTAITTSSAYDDAGGGATATTLDFSRTDTMFTFGYRLSPSFSLFAGHTRGVNKFTETAAVGTLFVTHTEFSEVGPFAGFAYNMPVGRRNNLSFSVGYAKLDAELNSVSRPTGGTFRAEGDNTGLSYTLTLSGPLVGSLSYRAGVKLTRYETEEPMNVTERYTSIFLGIVNYF